MALISTFKTINNLILVFLTLRIRKILAPQEDTPIQQIVTLKWVGYVRYFVQSIFELGIFTLVSQFS